MRELGLDRWLNVGLIDMERPDGRLNLPAEFFEHQVLIFHFRHEARGLEEPISVTKGFLQRIARCGVHCFVRREQARICVERVLDVVHESVMFRMEDLVDRCQRNVFVDPTIAGDEVRIKHFIVIRTRCLASKVS